MNARIESPRFSFQSTPLSDVWVINRKPIRDTRGFFSRFFCQEEFQLINKWKNRPLSPFQINHSLSEKAGTVRGLHFQYAPHAETKIVTCIKGKIFDVAVDLRYGSATFLKWFGVELSCELQNSLLIPPGFAHGFQTLSDQAEVLYLVTESYSSKHEDGIHPFDPAIAISWPLIATDVSERDQSRAFIEPASYAGLTAEGLRR